MDVSTQSRHLSFAVHQVEGITLEDEDFEDTARPSDPANGTITTEVPQANATNVMTDNATAFFDLDAALNMGLKNTTEYIQAYNGANTTYGNNNHTKSELDIH
eukprot:1195934-Prorocentrum_minimum.AAC.5